MTTLEHNGVEQSFAAWGFTLDSVQCEHVNLSTSRYIAFVPGASVADDPVFGFESKVIIRRNRTWDGEEEEFTGGYVAFIGYALSPRASQDGSGAGMVYEFANAWYLLENTCFEMRFANYNTATPGIEYEYLSEIILFTKLDGSELLVPQDSGEQIEEILTFASAQAVAAGFAQPYIIGTIDPAIDFPSYQAREMMCAAAILKCLEASPDVCCRFDYTTTLESVPTPTVHFLKRSSRTSKSLAILNGVDHKRLDITPRYDLQVRAVNLQYKITGNADGNTWILRGAAQRDKYGPNGANNAGDPDRGLRVLRQTIDLQGAQTTSVKIVAEAVEANHGTEATRLAWWKKKIDWLNSNLLKGIAIPATATIKDANGDDVDLGDFPNELVEGANGDWTGLTTKAVTITEKIAFTAYATPGAATAEISGLVTHKAVDHEISVQVVLIDGASGVYRTLAGFIGGEAMPTGIAQAVYESMSVLQYQGNDVRIQGEIANPAGDGPLVHLGHKLNLTGGRSAWTTMDAMIQRIVEHDGRGETTISFGPARHLAAGDLAAMFQWNRLRRYWENPKLRETSKAGNGIELPHKFPKKNTAAGSGNAGVISACGHFEE